MLKLIVSPYGLRGCPILASPVLERAVGASERMMDSMPCEPARIRSRAVAMGCNSVRNERKRRGTIWPDMRWGTSRRIRSVELNTSMRVGKMLSMNSSHIRGNTL